MISPSSTWAMSEHMSGQSCAHTNLPRARASQRDDFTDTVSPKMEDGV